MTNVHTVDDKNAILATLIERGLTLAECIDAFAARQGEDASFFIHLAREQWEREGEIEIDTNAITAGSDDHGDYVMAWVWVDDPRPEPDDDEEDEGEDPATASVEEVQALLTGNPWGTSNVDPHDPIDVNNPADPGDKHTTSEDS